MNHIIKGVILVVVITSMLFVGTTSMVPIMQNSFAHKKSDFNRADRDPNTNTNTNTNSADSTSSSDATAENTNNINNTATASNSQEQSACAVAVTCPEGSTTVTPPPATGTLQIFKVCVDFGCPDNTEFPITVTGNNPQPPSFTLGDGESQNVTLGSGSFRVTESVPPGFRTPGLAGDCDGTISAGQTLTCIIVNSLQG